MNLKKVLSAICFNLDRCKILLSGNGLKHLQTTNIIKLIIYVFVQIENIVG